MTDHNKTSHGDSVGIVIYRIDKFTVTEKRSCALGNRYCSSISEVITFKLWPSKRIVSFQLRSEVLGELETYRTIKERQVRNHETVNIKLKVSFP